MKHFILFTLLLSFCCSPAAFADSASFLSSVREVTLSNGMKFVLLRRSGAPVFSAYIRVKVGGVDEPDGKTGIAHLLEHMAFKGTREIGTANYPEEQKLLARLEDLHGRLLRAKGAEREELKRQMQAVQQEASQYVNKEEFSRTYLRNGGSNLNATTSQDVTSYFVSLPSNKLRLWAALESARLQDPVFREFYSERDVVMEERRSRVDDSSFGKLYEEFVGAAFQKSPYRRPTIGYSSDIERLSATDLRQFYARYYVPGNMVGAIVGDVDPAAAEKILQDSFGKIPPGPLPTAPSADEPAPSREKSVTVPFEAEPAVMIGYPKPTLPNRDDYVFDVFNQVFCEGRTSRLYQRLVVRQAVAQKVACSTSTPGSRLNNLFFIYASAMKGHSVQEIVKIVEEELQTLVREGIELEELEKAKKKLAAEWYYDMQSNEDLAELLSYFQALTGSWKYILQHPREIQSVTSQDLLSLVGKYLQPTQRTLAILKSTKPAS